MRPMTLLAAPARSSTRLEALPRVPRRPQAPRSSIEERPGREASGSGETREPSVRRSPLPKVLTGVRVLVVDDDEESREMFGAALMACGAEVVKATGAREAVSILTAQVVNVVLSDIAMP